MEERFRIFGGAVNSVGRKTLPKTSDYEVYFDDDHVVGVVVHKI